MRTEKGFEMTKCFFLRDTGRTRERRVEINGWSAVAHDTLYDRSDTGEETTLHDAPPGAMWWADWLNEKGLPFHPGPDGHVLMVRLPNGDDWSPDSRASNCGSSDDNTHHCWVRHGEVPNITVDKNGHTCSAGAGSIASGSYHGFLRGGTLT